LSFFTIETAKTDASIQDNLGTLRLAGLSAVGCTSGKLSTWVIPRLIAQWLSKRSSQQFIIENRPGANLRDGRLACHGRAASPSEKTRARTSFHGSETKWSG